MELSPELYQDPEGAKTALGMLGPLMYLFWGAVIILLGVVGFSFKRFLDAKSKAGTSAAAAVAGASAKDGKLGSGNYAGLSKEEMKLILDAEIKRRQEAGEEVVLKKPFEGPLDWEDVDEAGAPRPKAERPASYDEWVKQQGQAPQK